MSSSSSSHHLFYPFGSQVSNYIPRNGDCHATWVLSSQWRHTIDTKFFIPLSFHIPPSIRPAPFISPQNRFLLSIIIRLSFTVEVFAATKRFVGCYVNWARKSNYQPQVRRAWFLSPQKHFSIDGTSRLSIIFLCKEPSESPRNPQTTNNVNHGGWPRTEISLTCSIQGK